MLHPVADEDEELLAFSREKTLLCWVCAEESRVCAEESRVCGGSCAVLCEKGKIEEHWLELYEKSEEGRCLHHLQTKIGWVLDFL